MDPAVSTGWCTRDSDPGAMTGVTKEGTSEAWQQPSSPATGRAHLIARQSAVSGGIAPQTSAFLLAGSLVPTTIAGHGFWDIEDPAARKMQRVQFLKNATMVGGLGNGMISYA